MAAVAPLRLLPAREAVLAPLLGALLPRLAAAEHADFYELVASLDAQGLFPAQGRYALIASAWLQLAEVLPQARQRELLPLLRALTNALCHLLEQPQDQAAKWLHDWLCGVSLWPDTPSWLAWGQVLAWRWGLAALRPQALQLAQSWPEAVQRSALAGFSAAELSANPWLPGAAGCCRQRVLGGLRSWGGYLFSPPQLAWDADDTLWVWDRLQLWRVYLDAWGVHWQRCAGEALPPVGPQPASSCCWTELELPADAQVLGNAHTLAVTRPCSLQIWIFGHGAASAGNAILPVANFNA